MATACLVACSSGGSGTAGGQPSTTVVAVPVAPEGFTTVKIRVVAPDGTVVERCVLVADSDALRGRGLMGVTDPALGGIDAMVFTYDRASTSGFWMKNTLVPLSIAFADEGGTVTFTADMEPCPAGTDPCPVTTPPSAFRVAVEVPKGRLADLGLVPGGRIEIVTGTGCAVGRA